MIKKILVIVSLIVFFGLNLYAKSCKDVETSFKNKAISIKTKCEAKADKIEKQLTEIESQITNFDSIAEKKIKENKKILDIKKETQLAKLEEKNKKASAKLDKKKDAFKTKREIL